MKFGMEAEKFIFDMKTKLPSESVFSFLDALSDFERNEFHALGDRKATNEFVLNMIEFGTTPSVKPLDVLKDYLFNYLMIKNVAAREQVSLVPLASLPMDYLPHMTPKRAYNVQNSILAGKKSNDWMMDKNSPLRAAGNCAGIHVHAEIETPHEYLYSNAELKNKFNMGLMITPMIAFSSSPYFFNLHEARSMRGLRYFHGVYENFILNGGLPPVMHSSVQVLEFVRQSSEYWIQAGIKTGFSPEEMKTQVSLKSANWNPLRWNHRWNTIEIRCLDSDFFELDAAKFIWVCGAMKRMDPQGENLTSIVMKSDKKLDSGMIRECLKLSGKEVSVLPTTALQELFRRAMISGLKDDLVESYLYELRDFSREGLNPGEGWIFEKLSHVLSTQETTSECMLKLTNFSESISNEKATELVEGSIMKNDEFIDSLKVQAADIFQLLKVSSGEDHV
jgi:hypothetical protein